MISRVHHIGVVVRSLEGALPFFRDVLGLPLAKTALVREQAVKAALLTLPPEADSPLAKGDSEIELLEPVEPDSGIGRFLERRGEGLHHVCFETDDINAELAALKSKGVELIDQEPRRGLVGLICFLHPRALHGALVELAQPLEGEDAPGVELTDVGPPRARDPRPSPLLRRLDHLVLQQAQIGVAEHNHGAAPIRATVASGDRYVRPGHDAHILRRTLPHHLTSQPLLDGHRIGGGQVPGVKLPYLHGPYIIQPRGSTVAWAYGRFTKDAA
jgi:methylmalonyl-CoA/ethylmalonyl-CoA epimerase